MQKLKEYGSYLGLDQASNEAKHCLLGVILVKFGTGAIGIWGIISIYFFSYYKKYNDDLKMSEFSFLITFAAIPMSLIAIFSIQMCKKLGFNHVIRTAMIISPFSMMVGSSQTNFYSFALLNTIVASSCFGATVMPILYCIWSHFPKKTGNVTGIALASFGLATFFYSLITTFIVNPHNLQATIPYQEGQQTYYLFQNEVAQLVPSMTFWMGFIQMFFCIPGAFLISLNTNASTNNPEDSAPPDNNNQQVSPMTEKAQNIENPKNISQTDDLNHNSIELQLLDGSQKPPETNFPPEPMTLLQAARTTPFIIIYSTTFIISCFSLFISINFKIYGLTKINDDHFLTFLITFCSISSSLSNLLWGYLVDKYSFKKIFQIIIVAILIAGFLFPYISTTKIGFFLTFQTLSACERGLYTVIGPGLVQIFGLGLGAQLFPIKSTSFFLALVFLPMIQLVLLAYFNFDETAHLLLIGVAFSLWMSSKLKISYKFLKGERESN